MLFGFAGGYLVATRLLFPAPAPSGDLMEVPDLRRTALATAQSRLQEVGLELGMIDSLQHPESPFGEVLGQSPLPGQVALVGSNVRLAVSLGPERRPVPDVLRLREEDAARCSKGRASTWRSTRRRPTFLAGRLGDKSKLSRGI